MAIDSTKSRSGLLRFFIRWVVIGVVLLWSILALLLVAARWIDPPSTSVHIERRVQAWIGHKPYRERYQFIPLGQISIDFQHAVIAAEDARFYQHSGFGLAPDRNRRRKTTRKALAARAGLPRSRSNL